MREKKEFLFLGELDSVLLVQIEIKVVFGNAVNPGTS